MEQQKNNTENFKNEHLQEVSRRQQKPQAKRNPFADYERVNSYAIDLPNTYRPLLIELLKHSYGKGDTYMLKLSIGYRSIYVHGSTAFTVAEVIRDFTQDIVPDNLKPSRDRKDSKIQQERKEIEFAKAKEDLYKGRKALEEDRLLLAAEKEEFQKLKGVEKVGE